MVMRFILAASIGVLALSVQASAQQKLGQPLAERTPEQVYAKVCGYCHGRNVGPILLGRSLPVDAITMTVRSGRNAMPAFRPTEVTDAELKSLAKWISTSKANEKEHGQ